MCVRAADKSALGGDVCPGDSGSPLVLWDGEAWYYTFRFRSAFLGILPDLHDCIIHSSLQFQDHRGCAEQRRAELLPRDALRVHEGGRLHGLGGADRVRLQRHRLHQHQRRLEQGHHVGREERREALQEEADCATPTAATAVKAPCGGGR